MEAKRLRGSSRVNRKLVGIVSLTYVSQLRCLFRMKSFGVSQPWSPGETSAPSERRTGAGYGWSGLQTLRTGGVMDIHTHVGAARLRAHVQLRSFQ